FLKWFRTAFVLAIFVDGARELAKGKKLEEAFDDFCIQHWQWTGAGACAYLSLLALGRSGCKNYQRLASFYLTRASNLRPEDIGFEVKQLGEEAGTYRRPYCDNYVPRRTIRSE